MKKIIYKKILGQAMIMWLLQILFASFVAIYRLNVFKMSIDFAFTVGTVLIIAYALSVAGYLGYRRNTAK
ncbi:hypothetical protein [Oenococcus kitaharae]|uniref:Uncharacterized protein n=1 Tax=Oenococcus kitaharae DSM 17330 TaxID=1045004 RepID=G9WI05_9LACO|nr:hypothetical protein [Oenococcus kitaharae]EHN58890.1 hypothetical protein OKIT_0781 [Oenococcus kitaharae DSM 17330]MCV3296871.1 hypothetical protein [Oenococcus kitaharae]OEY81787.1 hypothetical protein NT96_08445 [Oenococcus kitaharae]OEY84018.1 hypothetical protein NT95_02505 [Oenococcus kitaharae]OEY85626.1 hypothetical protein NV75_03930 [Oenococcus kitaharae]